MFIVDDLGACVKQEVCPSQRAIESDMRSAQKRAEASGSDDLLAWIVKSSDDAIISKLANGVITSWNKGAQVLVRYLYEEEVVGQPISILNFPGGHTIEPPSSTRSILPGN